MPYVEVVGTGSYLPGDPISNEDLAEVFGRQIIWVGEMLGAATRHFAIDLKSLKLRRDESNANMATQAARQAISNADIDPLSIDLIIMATSTPDYPFPATVLFVQEQLGIPNCCAMELRAGCAGMGQAFLIATQMIQAGLSKTALLIGSDLISPFISLFRHAQDDLNKDFLVSLSMFGDGAGAIILAASSSEGGVLDTMSRSMSTGIPAGMILRTGGALAPAGYSPLSDRASENIFSHDFKMILKRGPDLIEAASNWLRNERGYDFSKVKFFIPPQVNARLISLASMKMKVPAAKVFTNFGSVGNTVSASIYIALDQMNRNNLLKSADLLILLPSEATKWVYGAIALRWTKRSADVNQKA